MSHLNLNTIVYQSRNNFKDYFFNIILGTHRKPPLAKHYLSNNTYTPDVEKEQISYVD